MSNLQLKIVVSGIAFLVIFVFGFWLSHNGKPYSTILITIHKLVAVGLVIFLTITLINVHKVVPFSTLILLIFAFTALCFVANVATGAMASMDKSFPNIVRLIHQVAPWLTLLSTSALLYLVLNQAKKFIET